MKAIMVDHGCIHVCDRYKLAMDPPPPPVLDGIIKICSFSENLISGIALRQEFLNLSLHAKYAELSVDI